MPVERKPNNKETGISIYKPEANDDFIKALAEAAGLDHHVILLANRQLGPAINQVLRRTLLSGLPAIAQTQGLRPEPEYKPLEEAFLDYAKGLGDEAHEINPSQLPLLIGLGLTQVANAARFFQAMSDLTLSQNIEADEKRAKAYVDALVRYLNGERPDKTAKPKQNKPTGLGGLISSWLNTGNQKVITPLDIITEIAEGTGWVTDKDEMLKMLTTKFAINAKTLVEGRALLTKAALAGKKDVDRAVEKPAIIAERLEPRFTKALQELATAEAERDAAAVAIGAGDPKARAVAIRHLADAQKKVFAYQLIVDDYDRKMSAAEGAEKSAGQFARVEASGLKLIGKNIGEVSRSLQFDTVTFLTVFGDIYACLTEATAEYNKEARIRIVNDYNAQIAQIPERVETEVKKLVDSDLKKIGAAADIKPEDVVEGTFTEEETKT